MFALQALHLARPYDGIGDVVGNEVDCVHFLARRVAIELKAGRGDAAEALIAEAQSLVVEPAPLWLALLIEARRYKLPKPKREPFEARWAEALTAKRRAETAAALADLLSGPLHALALETKAPD